MSRCRSAKARSSASPASPAAASARLGDAGRGAAATKPARGAKLLWGEDAGHWPIARARQSVIAFVPENPLEIACVGDLTVAENFALGARRYRRGLAVDWPRVNADVDAAYARLAFARPPPAARVRTLSGGNVQRVVMAREFATAPRLIVALYPTRGLDVRSAQAVREKLAASAAQGVAVLLMSEELEELFELSDRVVVLNRGRIAGVRVRAGDHARGHGRRGHGRRRGDAPCSLSRWRPHCRRSRACAPAWAGRGC